MQNASEAWKKVVEFHGHACPGLAVGFRIACAAADFLDIQDRSHDEELLCITETDACGVDAVQMLLGCSLGKGNLMLKLRGKDAMTFVHRPTGKACRIIWEKNKPGLPKTRAEMLDFILSDAGKNYCKLTEIPVPDLPPAFITSSHACAKCGEPTAEHMLLSLGGEKYCRDCAPQVSRIIL